MYTVSTADQLGKVLRGYRRQQKKTQTDVGDSVGLLQKTVSLIERETERSSIESLFKLMSALNLTMEIRSKDEASDIESSTVEW
ncbi:MAG: helix-turn-helix transcriptional regulator [Gammaproteobacteria bacterium]|nr:helix-turn-helix transcriptional regulator [Gammaproteobacteria bacterium]